MRRRRPRTPEDSCTIFLGRRRICFELLPPVRPEMIAVRRLDRGEAQQKGGSVRKTPSKLVAMASNLRRNRMKYRMK